MKRKYLFLTAIMLIAGLQIMAQQQKVTFTWAGSTSPKGIDIQASSGTDNIIVDWGDGIHTAEPYSGKGGSRTTLTSPAYSNTNNYDVIITAATGTDITALLCKSVGISTLGISDAPELAYLSCSGNQLTILDVSKNTKLTTLECNGNQLTELDVSNNTELRSFECYENRLISLDVSSNTSLMDLRCYSNAIPLIDLKNIADNTTGILITYKQLGTQTLATQTWSSATAVIDSVFGGESGDTEFAVKLDGTLTTDAADYSITGGEITFKQSGLYEIEISNATKLVSNTAFPAKVITSYQVTLPPLSTDATLSGLTVSAGTLTPTFSASVTEYTVTVANSVSSITLDATANDANATVSGTGSKSLNVGANPFNIVVTAEDGVTTETYQVTVSRENAPLSTDTTLSGLTVSVGTLTPAFSASVTEYTVTVANSVSSITLSATANHNNATVSGTGTKSLNVGANPFNIVVTAEDGVMTKTYKVTVTRENAPLSTDATLSGLTVSAGTLTPAFSSSKTEYTVTVANSVSSITLNATANHNNATVSGTGSKSLNVGANPFNIVVTAEDGVTTKTYKVTVTREKAPLSTDATLSGLTVSAGTLTPVFNASVTEYTVTVANSVSSITFSATANHNKATVSGTGSKNLNVGANPFNIVVMAEDGVTTKTYMVTVVREKSDVGIADVENAETYIYLNPVMNVLYVESPVPVQKLVIYNIHGTIVLQQNSALASIDVSALPQGMYIVKLITTREEIVKKFAKR